MTEQVERKYLMLMNKIMCILFSLLLFSCGNSISTNDNVSNTKIANEIKLDNTSVEFIADTTINK